MTTQTHPLILAAMHPLYTGHGSLADLPRLLSEQGLSGRVFIISDTNVLSKRGDRVRRLLEDAGWRVVARAVPPGESSKSIACASELWDWLVSERAERRDVVLALGGGVVGDLAGWVAATYLRGMRLVQLPTTLLAQVDSSIGGKTGIDHPRGKNLIGSFYPPDLTLVDTDLLSTLPARELTSGWAEVVKTALIADADLFQFLLAHSEELKRLEPEPLSHVVSSCAQIKLQVVMEDPKESGRRAILNYGHTIGHAVEAAAGYGKLLHGEAIAVGLWGAARIAVEMGLLPTGVAAQQAEALASFDLPSSAPGLDPEQVLEMMKLDKKVVDGGQRWVLLRDIARPELRSDVPASVVRQVVEECVA